MTFLDYYHALKFLPEGIRLQYSNFLVRYHNNTQDLEGILKRLKQNEPIEYILNIAEFGRYTFCVNKFTLIPRPETYQIINKAIDFISKSRTLNFTTLDIGTGSGCIVISLILELKRANISIENLNFLAMDISYQALEVARLNAKKFKVSNQINFINEDFKEYDFSQHENLIILSNLPYIPSGENLPESVKNYEPHSALFGGEKGDELNTFLMNKAFSSLNVVYLVLEEYGGAIRDFKL